MLKCSASTIHLFSNSHTDHPSLHVPSNASQEMIACGCYCHEPSKHNETNALLFRASAELWKCSKPMYSIYWATLGVAKWPHTLPASARRT